MAIHLIGPGGAGKSTVGPVLADRLRTSFRDLDGSFTERFGHIDGFIAEHGYAAYAHANVSVYRSVAGDEPDGVLSLSSGFMTYALAVHPAYGSIRHDIARSPTTVVLLPSLDFETCVAETVRRQLARPISRRSAEREEAVIRERFGVYVAVPAPKVETMRPPAEVAAEVAALLA